MAGRTLILAVAFILTVQIAKSENVDLDRFLDRFNSMEMEIDRLTQRVSDLETKDETKTKQIRQLEHRVQTLTIENFDMQLQQEESLKTILSLEANVEQLKGNLEANVDKLNGKFFANGIQRDGLNGESWTVHNDTLETTDVDHRSDAEEHGLNTGIPIIAKQQNGRSIADGDPRVAFYAQITPHDYGPLGKDQTIVFAKALTNVGNAYHAHNGIFTAPVDGVYVITVTIAGWRHTAGESYVHVMVNSNTICFIWAADQDQSSQTLILNLNRNDDVYAVNNVASDLILGASYSAFSGFLLYPT